MSPDQSAGRSDGNSIELCNKTPARPAADGRPRCGCDQSTVDRYAPLSCAVGAQKRAPRHRPLRGGWTADEDRGRGFEEGMGKGDSVCRRSREKGKAKVYPLLFYPQRLFARGCRGRGTARVGRSIRRSMAAVWRVVTTRPATGHGARDKRTAAGFVVAVADAVFLVRHD